MKKIDLENHFYTQDLMDALGERTAVPYYRVEDDEIFWTDTVSMKQGKFLLLLLDMVEGRKKVMDENGIEAAVLSCSPGAEQLDTAKSVEVCAKINETLYEVTKQYPGVFYGSAMLPVNDVDAACAELEKCVKEYGFVSWQTHSNYGLTSPDEEPYWPIFKKAMELGVYVYIHPQIPDDRRTRGCGFTLAAPTLGFTMDTITTTIKLLVSGLLDELPDLKIVLGHLGESIPFLLERMDNRLFAIPNSFIRAQHKLKYYFEHNILVTTSGNMSKDAFVCTQNVLGMDKICFASDYPYEDVPEMMQFLDDIPLTQKDREAMFYKNAVEQLKIPL